MDIQLVFATGAAFLASAILLAFLAWLIRDIALKREHQAEIRLILIPKEDCDRQRLVSRAYYIKERFFPQMVIEIAEGISPDKREDRLDNIPQR